RKRPDVTATVLGGVLSFAKRVALGRANDAHAGCCRFRMVRVKIFHADQNGMGRVGLSSAGSALRHYHGPGADQKLNAMIGDAQSFPEAELVAQPFRGGRDVSVSK